MARTILLVLVTLLLEGCQTASDSTSCNLTSIFCRCQNADSTCTDREGMSSSNAQSSCGAGTFSQAGLCTTTGRVGTCKIDIGVSKTYIRYYTDAVAAAAACTVLSITYAATGTVTWIPG